MNTMADRWEEFKKQCVNDEDAEVTAVMRDLYYCGGLAVLNLLAEGRTVTQIFNELDAYRPGRSS